MSETGKQVIYKQLLGEHGVIQVPIIQRDYAQGRESEADVRELFLSELEMALKKAEGESSHPLNLDFVYGSVEGEGNDSRFSPLDGQQRLTTLFLLHWYLAWKDDRFEDFTTMFRKGEHSRFTYRVRPSSNQFFDRMVNFKPESTPKQVAAQGTVSELIENQSWYFRNWRLDPTIQSALVMLDAIHERFNDCNGLFDRLTSEEQPAITFQLLDLDKFDLTDDLYIKMNARGMPLTPFETFKARYEQELADQFPGETRTIDGAAFHIHDFVARRLDTVWMDLFWAETKKTDNRAAAVDGSIFNLFRALALITRDPDHEQCLNDVLLLTRTLPNYTTFHDRGWLDDDFTETLIPLLEAWCQAGNGFQPLLPNDKYFDEKGMFSKICRNPLSLEVPEALQFMGYAAFIREHESSLDATAFQNWMRVVHNLVINSNIDRADRLPGGLRAILTLLPESGNILAFLAETPSSDGLASFTKQQLKEESLKAALLLNHDGWRDLIDQAELHGYFRGQIDFVLEMCGVVVRAEKDAVTAWDAATHVALQGDFREYLQKAEAMFSGQGLIDIGEFLWQRALLSVGNYLLPMGRQNESFLVDAATEPHSWKRLLRGYSPNERHARELLQQLWAKLDNGRPIAEQLNALIGDATGLEPWRAAFVRSPQAIGYCGKRAIRKISESEIYLLTKSQMNGSHAELFTFCLQERVLRRPDVQGKLKPLNVAEYQSAIGTDVRPGALLVWPYKGKHIRFEIEHHLAGFTVDVFLAGLKEAPEIQQLLSDQCGFETFASRLRKSLHRDIVEQGLIELAEVLSNVDR